MSFPPGGGGRYTFHYTGESESCMTDYDAIVIGTGQAGPSLARGRAKGLAAHNAG